MMKTKQEVIQILKLIGWNEIEPNHFLSKCGTYSIDFENYSFADTNGGILTFNNYEELLKLTTNNNGWIEIAKEIDLPLEKVWLTDGNKIWEGNLFLYGGCAVRINTLATHFQPIVKPLALIYRTTN